MYHIILTNETYSLIVMYLCVQGFLISTRPCPHSLQLTIPSHLVILQHKETLGSPKVKCLYTTHLNVIVSDVIGDVQRTIVFPGHCFAWDVGFP